MIRTSKRLHLSVALNVCCLVFIWGNSLLPGELSGQISDAVKSVLAQLLPPGTEEPVSGGFWVRKLAHFSEFACLGICLGWMFGMLGKKPYLPFLCGTAAACIDETIQIFVPGRGPGVRDVCIDAGGVAFGMLLLYLGHTVLKRRSMNKNHLEDT